jgi:hypothetical protein
VDEFWSAFLGTAAGSAIGIVGAVIVFRAEARQKYDARVDESVVRVLVEITRFSDELRAWARDIEESDLYHPNRDMDRDPERPEPHAVRTALMASSLVARGADGEVLRNARRMIPKERNVSKQLQHLEVLAGKLTDWRSAARPRAGRRAFGVER